MAMKGYPAVHGYLELEFHHQMQFSFKTLFLGGGLAIGLMSRVFANGPGDQGSLPGWVIPKAQKMVLDAALFNTQHYKMRIKGKVEQSWEWSSALPYTLV